MTTTVRTTREYGDRWRHARGVEAMLSEGWAVESTEIVRKRKAKIWLLFGLLPYLFMRGESFRVTFVREGMPR